MVGLFSGLFFKKKSSIIANATGWDKEEFVVDVRGQTCPGYMLAINKAIDSVGKGTSCRLLISYPPCGEDIESCCRQRKLEFISFDNPEPGLFIIKIKK